MVITDPHYFENTNSSCIQEVRNLTTDPGKDSSSLLEGKLLMIINWGTVTEFLYETYSVYVYSHNKPIDYETYERRNSKSNEQIIQEYINRHKEGESDASHTAIPENIIACNPHEYPVEKLTAQYI